MAYDSTRGVTLVAFYGDKPAEFAALIADCQQRLHAFAGSAFRPYAVAQVHATVVGLERAADADFEGLFHFLREEVRPIQIQIGGFKADRRYPFESRGEHPYRRSFSIQNDVAVAMGWPSSGELDRLRRSMQRFGVVHKYHRMPTDIDNDLFFVLGRLRPGYSSAAAIQECEDALRSRLAAANPVRVTVEVDSLSVVTYCDPRLPLDSSVRVSLADPLLTGARLRELYAATPAASKRSSPPRR